MDFSIGYDSVKENRKYWLIEEYDLKEMYDNMKEVRVSCCDMTRGCKVLGRSLNVGVVLIRMHPEVSILS